MFTYSEACDTAAFLRNKVDALPTICVILGSGFGSFADSLHNGSIIPYDEIPGFQKSAVLGHAGNLVFGELNGRNIALMCGRSHYYEGHSMASIAFPVAVMKLLGVKTLIVTNAAGGINQDFEVGDLMLLSDHIKLINDSPLRGHHIPELGPRFNDMSYTYTPRLREITKEAAYGMGINLREGVYAYMPGPNYETPAEIRALRVLGADVVGMSVVAETIAAANYGMDVLGISLVTNMAAGVLDQPLDHDEVMRAGTAAVGRFSSLINAVIKKL